MPLHRWFIGIRVEELLRSRVSGSREGSLLRATSGDQRRSQSPLLTMAMIMVNRATQQQQQQLRQLSQSSAARMQEQDHSSNGSSSRRSAEAEDREEGGRNLTLWTRASRKMRLLFLSLLFSFVPAILLLKSRRRSTLTPSGDQGPLAADAEDAGKQKGGRNQDSDSGYNGSSSSSSSSDDDSEVGSEDSLQISAHDQEAKYRKSLADEVQVSESRFPD